MKIVQTNAISFYGKKNDMDILIAQNKKFLKEMRAKDEKENFLNQKMKEKDAEIEKLKKENKRLEKEIDLLGIKNRQELEEWNISQRTFF